MKLCSIYSSKICTFKWVASCHAYRRRLTALKFFQFKLVRPFLLQPIVIGHVLFFITCRMLYAHTFRSVLLLHSRVYNDGAD